MMKRAFTLFEMLVVIFVISILLTLALPALSKSINKGKQTQCINNLRQIGYGMKIFSFDNNDFSMPASFGETNDGYVNHFINYMISRQNINEDTFKCPSMGREHMFDPDGHDPATGNIYTEASYIMNIIHPGNWNGANVPEADTAMGWGYDSVSPIPLGIVTSPSQKLHVMDVIWDVANTHSGINYFNRTDYGIVNDPPTGPSRWVGLLHNYGYNALFGDGHVSYLKFSQPENWAVNR